MSSPSSPSSLELGIKRLLHPVLKRAFIDPDTRLVIYLSQFEYSPDTLVTLIPVCAHFHTYCKERANRGSSGDDGSRMTEDDSDDFGCMRECTMTESMFGTLCEIVDLPL